MEFEARTGFQFMTSKIHKEEEEEEEEEEEVCKIYRGWRE